MSGYVPNAFTVMVADQSSEKRRHGDRGTKGTFFGKGTGKKLAAALTDDVLGTLIYRSRHQFLKCYKNLIEFAKKWGVDHLIAKGEIDSTWMPPSSTNSVCSWQKSWTAITRPMPYSKLPSRLSTNGGEELIIPIRKLTQPLPGVAANQDSA